MNFIIPFYHPVNFRYCLVGSFLAISSAIGEVFSYDEIDLFVQKKYKF